MTLQSAQAERSTSAQQQHIMINELSDLQAEYNRALIELQAKEAEANDLHSHRMELQRKISLLEEHKRATASVMAEKERLLEVLTRDFNNLKENFIMAQSANQRINRHFERSLHHQEDMAKESGLASHLDKSKDLSREIEDKINSVKDFFERDRF